MIWASVSDFAPQKISDLGKNVKNGVHFLTIFGIFLAHAGHEWPLFSRAGKKGTQNGSSGVWSHFCYIEMGQKRLHFGVIFELRDRKIGVENEKTQKNHFFRHFWDFCDSGVSRLGRLHRGRLGVNWDTPQLACRLLPFQCLKSLQVGAESLFSCFFRKIREITKWHALWRSW